MASSSQECMRKEPALKRIKQWNEYEKQYPFEMRRFHGMIGNPVYWWGRDWNVQSCMDLLRKGTWHQNGNHLLESGTLQPINILCEVCCEVYLKDDKE